MLFALKGRAAFRASQRRHRKSSTQARAAAGPPSSARILLSRNRCGFGFNSGCLARSEPIEATAFESSPASRYSRARSLHHSKCSSRPEEEDCRRQRQDFLAGGTCARFISRSPRMVNTRRRRLTQSRAPCFDSEERTGIRFEKERVYGYSGGAKALPGRPLAPAVAPIRGSRR
jgi:hypothetical protein